ncbi:MAG: hypothetical protein P3W93_002575, partial [Thermus sp.]|nr:hypothetical protein [Thermus sp.]
MKRLLPLLGLLLLVFAQAQVTRSYTSRYQTNTTGNIALIGNTLMTCSPSGTNGRACANARDGTGNNNSFTMVYVDVDTDPNTFNSSSADLALPSGATVLWAGLYWMSTAPSSGVPNPNTVLFRTPTMTTYASLTAIQTDSANTTSGLLYQGIAEVTDLVRAGGNGTYWVANVQGRTNASNLAAGWSLVVVYQHPAEPLRHLNVFDGWANVSGNTTVTTTVSGFLTPATGPVTVYLGVVALEGDMVLSGDRLRLNNSDVSNVLNPSDNFFNSTISDLGVHVTSKNPNYKNQLGFDIDRVKLDNALPNNATSANIDFVTTGDAYSPGVLTFAVNIFAPDLTTESSKSVVDLNGGKVLPGDILEYKVTLKNTGMDGATNVVLTDPIPQGTLYVPGSLVVVQNATTGPTGTFTDAAGDDIAEYDPACPEHGGAPCVRFRLGQGADASQGGLILPNEVAEIRFRVQVLPQAAGNTVTNTAYITYNSQTLGTGYSQTAQVQADVAIPYPPGLSKAFNPATIIPRDTSTLTLTLTNPNPYEATLTADLVDTLPTGLAVADPPGTSTTCPGGTVAANPGGNTLTLRAGAKIPAQGSCTVTVKVTALEPGDYTNTLPAGALQTDLGSNPEEATATLSVVGFTLSGTVYHDLEPNGLRGPEEDWSTGTTVYV